MVLDVFEFTEQGADNAAPGAGAHSRSSSMCEDDASVDAETPTPAAAASPHHPRFVYDLVGVVIHTGTSEAGHYYSLIRDRVPPAVDGISGPTAASPSATVNQWFEFNDHTVRPFKIARLEAETFGGIDPSSWAWSDELDDQVPRERSQNAYMLVYERRDTGGLQPSQATRE